MISTTNIAKDIRRITEKSIVCFCLGACKNICSVPVEFTAGCVLDGDGFTVDLTTACVLLPVSPPLEDEERVVTEYETALELIFPEVS